jgi:predicted anti-sigma-YlaC factor YlaD
VQHVYHLLDDYHDDQLASAARRRVEAHLQECPSCRAELERSNRLSCLLFEYVLPDTFTAAETFRAQVGLRLSRRVVERSGYRGAAWHLVPLAMLSGMIALQSLFVLSGVLWMVVRSARWLGVDVGLFLAQLGVAREFLARPEVGSVPVLSSTSMVATSIVLAICFYLGAFALLIPYAGWVGALWRSARTGQASCLYRAVRR